MSHADEIKIDVRERGANQQTSDRRLFMQLLALGDCPDPKPLVRTLESARVDAVVYRDLNDPRGVGILGMSEDRQFGPVILFGQGGVAVEVVRDKAVALPPLNLALARALMERTRVFRLLQGYRGRKPADLDGVALALVKLSQLVADLPEIAELDINPLVADSQGVIALDARIALRDGPAPQPRFAIRPYPKELERRLATADGGAIFLRPLRPEDEPAVTPDGAPLEEGSDGWEDCPGVSAGAGAGAGAGVGAGEGAGLAAVVVDVPWVDA